MPEEIYGGFERHFQTLVGALLIALITWVGISVTDSREKIGRMDEKLISMVDDMTDLKKRVDDGMEMQLRVNSCLYKIEALTARVNKLDLYKIN